MPYGIGAGGQLGIAFEVIGVPVLAGSAVSGGALTAGVYKYYLTAINAVGETSISNEITVTTSAGNLTAALTWAAITNATGYKVYRTAAAGITGSELLVTTLGLVTSYNDVAVGAPAGALPTANTAYQAGTYTAPTKFMPMVSEGMKFMQATQYRRVIRKTPDVIGAVPGDAHIEGPISAELLEDVFVYFLYASRYTVIKSGSNPNFVYTFTPSPVAIPPRTLSITVERVGGVVFGYTGCVVKSYKIGISNGMVTFAVDILGRDEASQALPTPTWPTSVPYGVGTHDVEIPTGTQVFDTDTYEFSVDFNGVPQYRLKNTGRGADFIKFGESNTTLTLSRDFVDRVDYDNFKALTSQSITLAGARGVNNSFNITSPVMLKNTYDVNLGGQGDLTRAAIQYQGMIDGSGNSHTIVLKTQENIV